MKINQWVFVISGMIAIGAVTAIPPVKKKPCSKDALSIERMNKGERERLKIEDKTAFCVDGKEVTASELRREREARRKEAQAFVSKENKEGEKFQKSRLQKYKKDTTQWKPDSKTSKIIADVKRLKLAEYSKIQGLEVVKPVEPAPSTAADTKPVIYSMNLSTIQPGDAVVITGQNFGTSRGTVKLQISANRSMNALVKDWNDTYIVFQVPDVSGVTSFAGWIQVHTTVDSAPIPIQFRPTLDVQKIPVRGRIHDLDPDESFPGWFTCADVDLGNAAFHSGATFLNGCSGTDTFLEDLTALKNEWVVDHVRFIKSASGSAEAQIKGGQEGSANASFSIEWRNGPRGNVNYFLEVYLRGPKGTNYQ